MMVMDLIRDILFSSLVVQNNPISYGHEIQTGADPGFPKGGGVDPFWRGLDLRHGRFSVKMYVKTKELGPVGGGRAPENFACRSANDTAGMRDR